MNIADKTKKKRRKRGACGTWYAHVYDALRLRTKNGIKEV